MRHNPRSEPGAGEVSARDAIFASLDPRIVTATSTMAEVATPIVGSQAADDAVGIGDHRAHASSPGVMTRVREEDITEIVTEEEAKAGGGFFRTSRGAL